jgi:hypothetical protein
MVDSTKIMASDTLEHHNTAYNVNASYTINWPWFTYFKVAKLLDKHLREPAFRELVY